MKVNAKINKSMYQVSSKWCFENNYRSTKVLPSLNILALVTFHLSDKFAYHVLYSAAMDQ